MSKRCLLFFTILNLFFLVARAQPGSSLKQQVTIIFKQDSLSAVLVKLQKNVPGDFAFDPAIVPGKIVSRTYVKTPLSDILDDVLSGTGLQYKLLGNALIIEKRKLPLYTIDGRIFDKASGEALIGASIYLPVLKAGTISNQYGFYSLTVPEGDYNMAISNLGYESQELPIHLSSDQSLDHQLAGKAYDLNEISMQPATVSGTEKALAPVKTLPIGLLNRLPYYAGEVDVIKALQIENGIKAVTEGSGSLFVRGGNSDQNLITLDEALIYNPSHLFGLVSVFNSDAIKKIQVYNDQIPANYGGRLSSVVDVRMADGNNKEFKLSGGASLLAIRVAAEGPIKKETGSFLLTARRSLIDIFNQDFKIVNPNSSYYDINFKANYNLNPSNRVYYSFYFGDDRLYSKNSYSNNWGNVTSTFRWNHEFTSKLFFNLSAIYSNYTNLLDVNADTISEKYIWKTGIRDFNLKGDFTLYKSPESEIKFGAVSTAHFVTPGEATTAFPDYFNIPKDRTWEHAAYISHQLSVSPKFQVTYGLRTTLFLNGERRRDLFDLNGNEIKTEEHSQYIRWEPRIYLGLLTGEHQRIHAAYNRTYQFLQLIQNNELTFSSLETWMPASKKTRPQGSDYWSAGYDYFPGKPRLSFNVYYKKLYNQIELLSHAQIIKNPQLREFLRQGTSDSYGAEITLSKTAEPFSFDAGYTYARVFKRIGGINNGDRFRANYDVPHEFKTTGNYALTDRFTISSFFIISSGRVATLPVGYYLQDGINVPLFEGRNRSRFPVFHRWDLSAKLSVNDKKRGSGKFSQVVSAGIYNVYNKRNPLFYRIKQPSESSLNLFDSTAGIIPWVAYSFKL